MGSIRAVAVAEMLGTFEIGFMATTIVSAAFKCIFDCERREQYCNSTATVRIASNRASADTPQGIITHLSWK